MIRRFFSGLGELVGELLGFAMFYLVTGAAFAGLVWGWNHNPTVTVVAAVVLAAAVGFGAWARRRRRAPAKSG
jgi:membrane protein implicated in regulation of membrane protease activity